MDAKLIKVLEHYHLYDGDKAIATTIVGNPMLLPNLSLKNCQEIERGYDLDELASERLSTRFDENSGYHKFVFVEAYKEGFQKALEIIGDKKFSEEDIKKAFEMGEDFGSLPFSSYTTSKRLNKKEYIQSLQQTEWDVEIEMICPHPMDTYRCGLEYGCDGDGCNHPEQVPYLDANGCLILKRKI